MRGKKLLILFIMFFFSVSRAAELAYTQNARTFETQHASLITKGLAHSCLSMLQIDDSLPCNPAVTSLNETPGLTIQGLLSNGYKTLEKTRKLINGDLSETFLNSLFQGNNILQIEGSAEANFLNKYFNMRWIPTSVRMFSVARNEANPQIELYAMEERGFHFQSGTKIYGGLYAGLQTRLLKRKFVKKKFALVDLGTENGRLALKAKKQEAYYFEPGLTYIFDHPWKPRVSVMVVNIGKVSEKYSELDTPVESQFGFGITPELGWGKLDLLLDFKSLSYQESDEEKIHFGTNYQFGSMNLLAGIDLNGVSGGLYYKVEKVSAGIVFSTTRIVNKSEEEYADTVYAQLGWQL